VFEGDLYIEISPYFCAEKVFIVDGTNEFILSFKEAPFFENYELALKESILGDGSFSVCYKYTN
jgi:hypothetical protein